eukprot:scaffold29055_cov71-Isochrysis_galbana.AAC.2
MGKGGVAAGGGGKFDEDGAAEEAPEDEGVRCGRGARSSSRSPLLLLLFRPSDGSSQTPASPVPRPSSTRRHTSPLAPTVPNIL